MIINSASESINWYATFEKWFGNVHHNNLTQKLHFEESTHKYMKGKVTYIKLFSAALFKIVNDRKSANCTIGDCLSKLWYSYYT